MLNTIMMNPLDAPGVKKYFPTWEAYKYTSVLCTRAVSHLNVIRVTGKSLGFYTDQLVDSMHQWVNKRFTNSNYYVKDITSDIHGDKLFKGVNHLNSYNLSK